MAFRRAWHCSYVDDFLLFVRGVVRVLQHDTTVGVATPDSRSLRRVWWMLQGHIVFQCAEIFRRCFSFRGPRPPHITICMLLISNSWNVSHLYSGYADWEEVFSLCRAQVEDDPAAEKLARGFCFLPAVETGLILKHAETRCSPHWLSSDSCQFSDKHSVTGTDAAKRHYFGLCPTS